MQVLYRSIYAIIIKLTMLIINNSEVIDREFAAKDKRKEDLEIRSNLVQRQFGPTPSQRTKIHVEPPS